MGLITGEVSLTVLRDRPEDDWQESTWAWTGGPVALLTEWQLGMAGEGQELNDLPAPGTRLQLGAYACRVLETDHPLLGVWLAREGQGDRALVAAWLLGKRIRKLNARVLRQLARWGLAVPEEAMTRTWLDVRPLWDLRQVLRRIRAWRAARRRPAGPQPPEHANCRCVVVELRPAAEQAAAGVGQFKQAADALLVRAAEDAAKASGITFEQAVERIQAWLERNSGGDNPDDEGDCPAGDPAWLAHQAAELERPPLGPPLVAGQDGELEMPQYLEAEIRTDDDRALTTLDVLGHMFPPEPEQPAADQGGK